MDSFTWFVKALSNLRICIVRVLGKRCMPTPMIAMLPRPNLTSSGVIFDSRSSMFLSFLSVLALLFVSLVYVVVTPMYCQEGLLAYVLVVIIITPEEIIIFITCVVIIIKK